MHPPYSRQNGTVPIDTSEFNSGHALKLPRRVRRPRPAELAALGLVPYCRLPWVVGRVAGSSVWQCSSLW